MPPDSPETPQAPDVPRGARQRAHDALDRAFTTRTVRGEETTGVNLSLLTDQLRYEGVPIEVRRVDRRRPDPAAEAATKSVAAATPDAAELTRRLADGEGWMGTHPAAGTRRALILDTLRAASPRLGNGVGGHFTAKSARDIADAIESALLKAAIEEDEERLERSAVARAVRKETGQGLVTVVVGGHRIDVEWHPDDEHAALIQRALSVAGIAAPHEGEPWRWWQLRDEAGAVVDPAVNCGLDFDASETLFLDPYAGGGADYETHGYPEGLLFSERKLWDRAQDKTVMDVLARLSRERAERKAVEEALHAAHIPPGGSPLERVGELARRLDVAERIVRGREIGEAAAQGVAIKHPTLTQIDNELRDRRREVVDAGNELDRISIPRSINAEVLPLPQRVKLLVQRYLGQRTAVEALTDDRPETFPATAESGWQGTEPAEGTRRRLIRDTIQFEIAEHPVAFNAASYGQKALKLADAVESALLQSTIDEEAMERAGESMTEGIEKVDPCLVEAEVEKALNHLIFAMQAHREEGYPGTLQYGRSIRKAIIAVRQIKEPDLEGAGDPGPRDDENPNVWAAKSIARSVDALSTTLGGALRELLDRTATDRGDDDPEEVAEVLSDASREGMGT